MRRFVGPGWRILGSAASWLLFSFSFLALFQVTGVVSGLGGFCASGGPYVIETECPESVVVFAPLSIFGMFIAVGVGLIFARGFGTPLLVWAWPILFIGLGVQFGLTALRADIVGVFLGLLFVGMGAVPLIFELRGGARVLRGTHNLNDESFTQNRTVRRTIYGGNRWDAESAAAVPATVVDWVLSVSILLVSIGLGAWLSFTAFNAVAVAG